MPTRLQSHQIVNEAALPGIGKAARAQADVTTAAFDAEITPPLKIYGATTPDSKLYIGPSQVPNGDGTARSIPPQDAAVNNAWTLTTVDFSVTSSWVAGSGTVLRDGATFSMPTITAGRFLRIAFVFKSDGTVNTTMSDGTATTRANLPNAGTLFAKIDGIPLGWIDLVALTGGATYKTADSAGTASIVENAVSTVAQIVRFGSGAGTGSGGDTTAKILSFAATGATVKGGYIATDDGQVLSSGTGTSSTTAAADLTLNLNNVLTASGLAALGTLNSAASVVLALVVDRTTLATTPTALTDNKRQVYQWGESNLKLLSLHPEGIDPRRYVLLDQIFVPQTVSAWTTATAIAKPQRVHDSLSAYFPYAENYSTQLTAGSGLQTLTHNLSAEPQIVLAYYFDGTNKNAIDVQNVVVHKSSTQIKVNVDAYDITGGKYVEIQAVLVPGLKALASASRTFTSAWFTSTATTTLPHGLNDREDIRGYEVQHYDTSTGKVRNIDRSAVVVTFDDTNFTLDWTGLLPAPSATQQYRIVAGGSPLPWAIPTFLTGYTKYVGQGPGSYGTVTAALAAAAAGDRILVMRDSAETAALVVPAGVEVEQMPNTLVTLTATTFASGAIRLTGANAKWRRMNAKVTGINATLAKAVSVEAADCKVEGDLEIDCTGQTVTDAVNIAAGGTRAYVQVGVKRTNGVITNLETNADGAGKSDVWGG